MGRKRIGAIEMGPTELADRLKVGGALGGIKDDSRFLALAPG